MAKKKNAKKKKAQARLDKKTYEKELERLQIELVKMQEWVVEKGLKAGDRLRRPRRRRQRAG